jgi:site-specific DNA recombinase
MSRKKIPLAEVHVLRAVLYLRMSVDKDGKELGIDRQHEVLTERSELLGLDVVGVYGDNNKSASNPAVVRSEYQRLLKDMRAGKFDVVLVWNLDRLVRQSTEMAEFIAISKTLPTPIQILSIQAVDIDLNTPGGRLSAKIMADVAEYEGEIKSERQKLANLQAAKLGTPARGGRRAFGFEDDRVTQVRTEVKAIREAVPALLAGESLNDIARRWNAQGIRTTGGTKWTGASVRAMLKRPRLAGKRVYKGKVIADGQWEPVVDPETWNALLALLEHPDRKTGPGPKPRHLLSGIALCGYPGCDYTMKTSASSVAVRGGGKRLYKCRGTNHVSRQADPVDKYIEEIVIERLRMPDLMALMTDEADVDLTALRDKARVLRGRLEGFTVSAAKGETTPEQLATITKVITGELVEIQDQIAASAKSGVLIDAVGDDAADRWSRYSLERKRAIIDALMTITVLPLGRGRHLAFNPQGIVVNWRKPTVEPPARDRKNRSRSVEPRQRPRTSAALRATP